MARSWDVVVAGLGAAGSAALYQLSRRGARAVGFDRFRPPHDRGSSHGDTRITRLAVGEGDAYVPLVRRSHAIWRELEEATNRSLFTPCGGLVFGPDAGAREAHGAEDFLRTTEEVAERHGIAHEILGPSALARRFPQFRFTGDETGYFEPGAGFVRPEACIAAQLECAERLGAEVRADERVLGFASLPGGVRVETDRGACDAAALVVTAGAWIADLVAPLAGRALVYRQVLHWFEPEGPHERFAPDRMPVFIHVGGDARGMFYGFPAIDGPGGGLKIAGEQFDRADSPDAVDPSVRPEEIDAMRALASPRVRISARHVRSAVCKYTVLPGFRFAIDRHPDHERAWFASACSGHGFKHSAAVGEALAEGVLEGRTTIDLSAFRWGTPAG